MQIEWSEGEVLKLAGVGTEAEVGAGESVGGESIVRKRWDTWCELGIGQEQGGRRAERGEPCRVFELWGSFHAAVVIHEVENGVGFEQR